MKPILRELIATNKNRYRLGTYFTQTVENDNYITLPKISGVGLSYLKIEGSENEGVALNDNGLQVRICKKNLIDPDKLAELILSLDSNAFLVEVDGRRCIKYQNSKTYKKDLTASCPAFKKKTRYIFSIEAKPYVMLSETASHDGSLQIGFKSPTTVPSVSTPSWLDARTTVDFRRMYAVSKSGITVNDINLTWGGTHHWLIDLDSVYLYEYEGNNDPEYEAPHVESATLEPTFLLNGEEISVRLAEGESLVFDNGRVKYFTADREYDLTDSDFGKELCKMKGAYGNDFTLMVKSSVSPGSLTVGYYSTEHSDTATLRVKYLCDGVEIMQAREYLTRKNGAFTVIAPSIEGYLPQKRQISGVIDGDMEISIEYRGKK